MYKIYIVVRKRSPTF